MVRPIVVHRLDKNNVGDMASDPLRYFMPGKYDVIDVAELHSAKYDHNRPIIVGGGGLIANDFIGDSIKRVLSSNDYNQLLQVANNAWDVSDPNNTQLRSRFMEQLQELVRNYIIQLKQSTNAPRIAWGIGHNADAGKRPKGIEYPDWLVCFDKLGIRDFNQQYPYVPCASCMHPALRKKYPIKNEIIWFEHKKQLLKSTDFGPYSIPRFVNSGANIEQTIELLGSANVIITNSYHGAYWGMLLGKKVIVQDSWSTKFYYMRPSPAMAAKGTKLEDLIPTVKVHTTALDECINITEKYWSDVKGML